MTLTEQDRRMANIAARTAERAGRPITSCPWPADGDDRQRALRGIWVRTFLRHRPELRAQVDHSG